MVRTESNAGTWLVRAGLALAAAAPGAALAAREWNLQEPVTSIARQMYDLHTFIFWICVVIFVAVFGVMFYSIFKHRKSVGHEAHLFHENTTVEIVWTVIPFLILLFMAFPATKTILAMKDTSAPDMTIKVTGYQWKWSYDYLQDGFGFYSSLATPLAQIENRAPKGENYLLEVDNPLVVPVGHQGARADHRERRAARVVGAGVRRQAGRDPRLRPRYVVPGGKGRHLSRSVRRAVRQGARLHADRRRGEVEGRLREVGRRAEEEGGGRGGRPRQGLGR